MEFEHSAPVDHRSFPTDSRNVWRCRSLVELACCKFCPVRDNLLPWFRRRQAIPIGTLPPKNGGGGSATAECCRDFIGRSSIVIDSKRLIMVEAGGVELSAGIENTQLVDFAILPIAPFARFARSVSRSVTWHLAHGRSLFC